MLTTETKTKAIAALGRYAACLAQWDGGMDETLNTLIAQESEAADKLTTDVILECEAGDPDAEILELLLERVVGEEGTPQHAEAAAKLIEGMATQ